MWTCLDDGTAGRGAACLRGLVGQDEAVLTLVEAARAAAAIVRGETVPAGSMTHAWLFTGPPGIGPVGGRAGLRRRTAVS
jgi:hypothetical protein